MTTNFKGLTPQTFADATWPEILPLYDELASRPLDVADPAMIDRWLTDWNALDVALIEASLAADFNASGDTLDPDKEAAYLRFSSEIGPQHQEQVVRLAGKLLDTGYTRPDLEMVIARFCTERDIFREQNIPLEGELQELNARYNKLTGGMMVEWDGRQIPTSQLGPFLLDADATVRERAWRLQFAPYIAQRAAFADIFDAQLEKRQRIAHNAGFANYRDYMFKELHRYDYSPDDCLSFHDAVAQTFVPAIARRLERRKTEMALDSLRPWDLASDTRGRPALRPYKSIEELNATSENVFRKVDPVFGDYFHTMRTEAGLLDLESRQGKRPGGFCDTFPFRKRPYIFMNAAGIGEDVDILMHEAGHAFHGFEQSEQPFFYARQPGEEMCEVASMAMELLTAPYLGKDQGGFYTPENHRRASLASMESRLEGFAYVAIVDAFQHWLYTDPAAADRDARDAKFVEISQRFDPGLDWTELEAHRAARWHKQVHIFLYPFYYIEYAIALPGALQVWRNSLTDRAMAIADYRAALALGATRPLPALFERAGARLIFDASGMAELVGLIEEQLAVLDA